MGEFQEVFDHLQLLPRLSSILEQLLNPVVSLFESVLAAWQIWQLDLPLPIPRVISGSVAKRIS